MVAPQPSTTKAKIKCHHCGDDCNEKPFNFEEHFSVATVAKRSIKSCKITVCVRITT
jgi:hypothetical protein